MQKCKKRQIISAPLPRRLIFTWFKRSKIDTKYVKIAIQNISPIYITSVDDSSEFWAELDIYTHMSHFLFRLYIYNTLKCGIVARLSVNLVNIFCIAGDSCKGLKQYRSEIWLWSKTWENLKKCDPRIFYTPSCGPQSNLSLRPLSLCDITIQIVTLLHKQQLTITIFDIVSK